mgnify:FL=1
MKKMKFTLFSLLLTLAITVFGQDGIHGVDGYYNWTAKQMKADNILKMTTTGFLGTAVTKQAGFIYNDDYVKVDLGLKTGANNFRGDFQLNYNLGNTLKITKQYPVIAFKLGYPDTTIAKGYDGTIELAWKYKIKEGDTIKARTAGGIPLQNAISWNYNGSTYLATNHYYFKNTMGKGGWNNGGRFQYFGWWKKINNEYQYTYNSRCAIGDSINKADANSSLVQGYFKVDDPIANRIIYVNMKHVVDSVGDIEVFLLTGIHTTFLADTAKTVILRNEAGDSIGTQKVSKTNDELPYYNLKWVKTFPTVAALKEATTINAGDGNDTRSANQLILNASLYYAKKFLQNYAYADAKYRNPYQAAFDAALAIYQTTPPNEDKTSIEWLNWDNTVAGAITNLAAAKTNFLNGITAKISSPYSVIKTVNGEAEFVLGQTKTLSTGISGKLVELGGQGSGTPLLISKSTTQVNGRTAFTLSNVSGKLCIVKDTLIFVENSKVTSAILAQFVISNRSDDEFPAYDVYVNGKFLMLNQTSGKLATVAEIPDGEISDLGTYLFDLTAATYDPANDDPTISLFEGWEFENGNLHNIERNTWRMYSQFQNTVKDGKGCLEISIAPTYYTAQDSLHTTLLKSDFITGMEGGYRRESGVYPNSAKLNPTTRDSSLIIWTNTYKKRYLAVKTAGTDPTVVLNKFTFYATPIVYVDIALADTVAVKGDVYVYDMLAKGIPYGNIGWNSQYFSVGMFKSAEDKAFVDWIRMYDTIENVPNELLDVHSGVFNPSADNNIRILTNQNTITVNSEKPSEITLYSMNGIRLTSQVTTKLVYTANNKGIYIVSVRDNNRVVSEKVVIK